MSRVLSEMVITFNSPCLACMATVETARTNSQIVGKRVDADYLPLLVCSKCGHIMFVTADNRLLNLTKDQKQKLRRHPFATEIREHQKNIVERLIG